MLRKKIEKLIIETRWDGEKSIATKIISLFKEEMKERFDTKPYYEKDAFGKKHRMYQQYDGSQILKEINKI